MGSSSLEWTDVTILNSGRVVACGTEHGVNTDLVVQAWEPDGTIAWIYRYPDPGDATWQASGKIATNGTDIFVAGSRGSFVNLEAELTLILRLSQNGALLDQNDFLMTLQDANETITGIAVNPAATGEVFVTGYSTGAGRDGWVMKLQSNLEQAWLQDLTYAAEVRTSAPLPLPDGKVLIPSAGPSTTAVAKYGTTGLLEATYTVPSSSPAVQPLTRSATGQVVLLSYVSAGINISKLDSNLGLLGTTLVNDHFYNYGSAQWSDAAGGLFVCSDRYSEGLLDMRKYSPTGTLLWTDVVPNVSSRLADYLLKVDRFGNPVVIGNEEHLDGNVNFVGWCWDSSGHRQWKSVWSSTQTSNDFPRAWAVDSKLRLYAVGKATNPANFVDTKGAIWRTSQYFHRAPDLLTMRSGTVASGTLADLAEADGTTQTLCVQPGVSRVIQPVIGEYETTFPIEAVDPAATTLDLHLVASCNISGAKCVLQCFNWTTGLWQVVLNDTLTGSLQAFDAPLTVPADFVQAGTRLVRARILCRPARTRSTPFCVTLDQLEARSDT